MPRISSGSQNHFNYVLNSLNPFKSWSKIKYFRLFKAEFANDFHDCATEGLQKFIYGSANGGFDMSNHAKVIQDLSYKLLSLHPERSNFDTTYAQAEIIYNKVVADRARDATQHPLYSLISWVIPAFEFVFPFLAAWAETVITLKAAELLLGEFEENTETLNDVVTQEVGPDDNISNARLAGDYEDSYPSLLY